MESKQGMIRMEFSLRGRKKRKKRLKFLALAGRAKWVDMIPAVSPCNEIADVRAAHG